MAELQARLLAYARAGDAGGVEATLRGGAGLDTPGMDSHPGRCAIHHASAAGHVDVVRLLISWGTDVNLISRFDGDAGGRPAHLAAEAGYTRTLMDLLEAGADPFYYDAQGYLPVHRAAARGRWRVLKVFKYYGYDLSARTADWSTSLHLAAACGNLRLVTWLVYNGVRPDLTDQAGRTAHNHPQVRFHKEVQDYLARVCRMFQYDSWGNSYFPRGYYPGQYRTYQGRQYTRHNRSYTRPQKISRANQASSSHPAEEETDELELESSTVDQTSTFSSIASSAMDQTAEHTETSLPVDNALSQQPKESTHMETSTESTQQRIEVSPQNEGAYQQPSMKLMNGLESPVQTSFSESVWTQSHTASQRKKPWQMDAVNVARGNTKERPVIDVTENTLAVKEEEEVQNERESCERSVREVWEKDYLGLCERDDQNGCHSLGEDADSLSHPHPDVYQTETEAINEWQLKKDQNSQWETSEGTKAKEKEVVTIGKQISDDLYQRGFVINEEMEAKLHPSEQNNNRRKVNEDVNSDMLNNNHLEEKEFNGVMPTGDILDVEEKSYQKLKVIESKEQTEERIRNSHDNKQKELGNDILKSKNKNGTSTKEKILRVGVKATYKTAAEEVEKVTVSNEYRSKDNNKENEFASKNDVEKQENKRETLDKPRIGDTKSSQKTESVKKQKNEHQQETNHNESGMLQTSKPEPRISRLEKHETYILNGKFDSREELQKIPQQIEAPRKKKIDELEVQNTLPIEKVSHPNSTDQEKQEQKKDEESMRREKNHNGKETTSTKKESSKMGKNKKDKHVRDISSAKATSQTKLTEREKGKNMEANEMAPKENHEAKQTNGAKETIPKEPKGNKSEAERTTTEEMKREDSKIEGPVTDVSKAILPDENECKIERAVAKNPTGDKSKVQEQRIDVLTEVKIKESYLVSEVKSMEKQTDSKSKEPRTKAKTGDHEKTKTLELLTEDRKVEGTRTEECGAQKPVVKLLQVESEPDPVLEHKAKLKTKKSKRDSHKQEIQSKMSDVKQSHMEHHNTGESQNKEPLISEPKLEESNKGEPQEVVSTTEPMTEEQKQKSMPKDHTGKSHKTVRFAPDLNMEQHKADETIQADNEPQELKADKPNMETKQSKIEGSDKKHSKKRRKREEVEAPSEINVTVPKGECAEDSRGQVMNASQLGKPDISEQTPRRSESKDQKSLIRKDTLKEKKLTLPQKEVDTEKKTDELQTQNVKTIGHESDPNRMVSEKLNLKQNRESLEERETEKELDLTKKANNVTKKTKKERSKNKRSSDEATSAPKPTGTAGENESIKNEKQTQPPQAEEMKVERNLEKMEPKEVERSESKAEEHREEPESEKTKIQVQNIREPVREEHKAKKPVQFECKKKKGEKSKTEQPKDRNVVGEETKKKELMEESLILKVEPTDQKLKECTGANSMNDQIEKEKLKNDFTSDEPVSVEPLSVEGNAEEPHAECIELEEPLSQQPLEEYLELTLDHYKAEPNALENKTENPQQEIETDMSKEEKLQIIVPEDKEPLVEEPKEKESKEKSQVKEPKRKEPVKETKEKEHPDKEPKEKEPVKEPKRKEPVKETKEKEHPDKELKKKEHIIKDPKEREPQVKESKEKQPPVTKLKWKEPSVKELKQKEPPVKELWKKEPSANDIKEKGPPVKEPKVEVPLDKEQQAEESQEELSTKDKQVSETRTKLCKRVGFAQEELKAEICNTQKVSEEKTELQESAAEDLNTDIKVTEINEEISCGAAETVDICAKEFQANLHKQKDIKSEGSCTENPKQQILKQIQPDVVHETRDTNSENSKAEKLKMMETKTNDIQARGKKTNFIEEKAEALKMDETGPRKTKPKTLSEDDNDKFEKTITVTPITEMAKVEKIIIKQPLKEGSKIAKHKEPTPAGNLKKDEIHTKKVTEKRGGNNYSTSLSSKAKRKDKQRRQKHHLTMQRIELSFPNEIQHRREHTHKLETKSEVQSKGVKIEDYHNFQVSNKLHTESKEKAEQKLEEPGTETKYIEESRGKEKNSLQPYLSSKHKSRLEKKEEAKKRKKRKQRQKKAELANTSRKPGRKSQTEEPHMLTVATEDPKPRYLNPEMPYENEIVPLKKEHKSEMKTKKRINTDTKHEIQKDVVRDENAGRNLELNSGKKGITEEEFLGIDISEKKKPQIEDLKPEPCSKKEDEELRGEYGVSCFKEETSLSEMPSCVIREKEHTEFAGEEDEINYQNNKNSEGKPRTNIDYALISREIENKFDPMHECEVNPEICNGIDLMANGQSQMSPEEPIVESCKEPINSELVTLAYGKVMDNDSVAITNAEIGKVREEPVAGGITAENRETEVEAVVIIVAEKLTLNTNLADVKEAGKFEGDIIEQEPAANVIRVAQEPAADSVTVEEPAADSVTVEEPVSDIVTVEEPAANIVTVEEPAADSVTVEEPAADSVEVEETVAYIVTVEEPAADSVTVEGPAADIVTEEPAADSVPTQEPAADKDSVEVEEPAADNVEVEEPAADIVTEEPAADSVTVGPVADIVTIEEPAADSVEVEKPAADSVLTQKPAADSVVTQEPAADSVTVEEPAADSVTIEKPAANSVEVEEPAADGVEVEQPSAVSVEVEEPAADGVEVEEPAADGMEVEEPAADGVEVEEPATDGVEVEEPATDGVEVEEPAADGVEVEEPAAVSVEVEEPAADSVTIEKPAANSVEVEEPAANNVEVEEPATDGVEVEKPAADSVEVEKPAADSVVTEEPAADSVEVEKSAADSVEVEKPAADSVVIEEPAADSVEVENTAADSVEVEKPAADSVVTEEPAADGVEVEEPAADGVEVEEPVTDSGVEEPAADSVVTQEPAVNVSVPISEPAADSMITQEPAAESVVAQNDSGVAPEPAAVSIAVQESAAIVTSTAQETTTVKNVVAQEPTADSISVAVKEEETARKYDVVTEVSAVEDGVTEVPAVEDGVTEESAVEDGVTGESSAESTPADKEEELGEGVVADSDVAVEEPISVNDKSSQDPKSSSSTSPDTTRLQKALASLKERVKEIECTFLETVQHEDCGGEEVEDESLLHQPDVPEKVNSQGRPNPDNTSYITSVVQCLFSLPTLRHYFTSDDYRNDLGPAGNRGRKQVAESLAQVLKALAADGDTSSAVQLLRVVMEGQGLSESPGGAPHHAFTLLCSLLTGLHQELRNNKQQDASSAPSGHARDTSVISDWFQGMHETRYTCGHKKFSISRSKTLLSTIHIKVPFNTLYSLQELLRRHPQSKFVEWYCPACHVRHPCHHHDWLVRPPPILIICIHRGIGEVQKQETKSPPTFLTEDLSLRDLLLPRVKRDADYRLQGMITVTSCHHHHAAYCYDPICHVWKHYKDGKVSETDLCTVLADMDVAILFYVARE